MPETDVTKMKVADLKRELKLRGLAVTGNKTELQDRLQTSLIDGELSLEDTAISAEDLLDEDLTDEEEAKILGADENELLKSPISTPTTAPSLTSPLKSSATEDDVLGSPNTTPTAANRKIVLKRKNSFITTLGSEASATAAATAKENTEPSPLKTAKMSERNPITISNIVEKKTTEDESTIGATSKVAQLSLQERLEMRAKKFGITNTPAAVTTTATVSAPNAAINNAGTTGVTDEKQIEMLKKRADRFGCVVSSKIAKIDADEKLQKRKQRFGGGADAAGDTTTTSPQTSSVWAEKARLRLERFKAAPTSIDSAVTVDGTTAAAGVVATDK